jgi:hypothetical protein
MNPYGTSNAGLAVSHSLKLRIKNLGQYASWRTRKADIYLTQLNNRKVTIGWYF